MNDEHINPLIERWKSFADRHPTLAQLLMFFIVSNGVTLLQLILMPVLKYFFCLTNLVDVNFQILQCGTSNGTPRFVFDYASGAISVGGGGGLAYFLAVEITMLIAQIINFFLQRNVTFKADGNIYKAALWYFVVYILISVGAALAQNLYKDFIYRHLQELMGATGIVLADIITMLINCMISFWIFFPVFKLIFKKKQ